jgi:hypothetical protein
MSCIPAHKSERYGNVHVSHRRFLPVLVVPHTTGKGGVAGHAQWMAVVEQCTTLTLPQRRRGVRCEGDAKYIGNAQRSFLRTKSREERNERLLLARLERESV